MSAKEENTTGTAITLTVNKHEQCNGCKGKGWVTVHTRVGTSHAQKCPICLGTGKICKPSEPEWTPVYPPYIPYNPWWEHYPKWEYTYGSGEE